MFNATGTGRFNWQDRELKNNQNILIFTESLCKIYDIFKGTDEKG